jgi:hypothetical protein
MKTKTFLFYGYALTYGELAACYEKRKEKTPL